MTIKYYTVLAASCDCYGNSIGWSIESNYSTEQRANEAMRELYKEIPKRKYWWMSYKTEHEKPILKVEERILTIKD